MTTFAELVPRVKVHVPVAPLAVIIDAIQTAAVDFCRKSNAYRFGTGPIPAIANVEDYEVSVPAGTRICRIMSGTWKDKPLYAVSTVQRAANGPTGTPYYYQLVGQTLRVTDAPVATEFDAFQFELALEPTMSATGMDDEFVNEHYQAIVWGAITSLLMMPLQPWSAPQSAAAYEQHYIAAISRAEGRANDDHTPKRRQTRYGGLQVSSSRPR